MDQTEDQKQINNHLSHIKTEKTPLLEDKYFILKSDPAQKAYPVLTYDQYLHQASSSSQKSTINTVAGPNNADSESNNVPKGSGFSKIQLLAVILVFVLKVTGYMLSNNIGFLELEPEFTCTNEATGTIYSCETTDFCDEENNSLIEGISLAVNWESSFTLFNFITKYELYCKSSFYTVMIGVSIKIGSFVYLIFFSHFIDTIGRKKVVNGALVLQMASLLALIVSPSSYLLLLYLFLIIQSVAINFLQIHAWIYFVEFMPQKWHSFIIVVSHVGRAFGFVVGSLFFAFVSKSFSYFFLLNIGLSILVLGGVLIWFTESPKYYYMLKQFKKARAIMYYISRQTSGQKFKAFFVEEVEDENIEGIDQDYLESSTITESSAGILGFKDDKGIFNKTHFLEAMRDDKVFRINVIAVICCHIASSFIMDLVVYMLPNLDGNVFLNAFMVGISEMFAYAMSGILIRVMGLRPQLIWCYVFPFVCSAVYIFTNAESDMALAIALGLVMFGVAANNNSTIYAAYVCTPKELSTTFFVFQNYFKLALLFLSPIIAEYNSRGIFFFILIITGMCSILANFIQINEKQLQNGGGH